MKPLTDLKDGYLYVVRARNAKLGVYNKDKQSFTISRTKFDYNYLFDEYLYTFSYVGTVYPKKELSKVPGFIRNNKKLLLFYLNVKEWQYRNKARKIIIGEIE